MNDDPIPSFAPPQQPPAAHTDEQQQDISSSSSDNTRRAARDGGDTEAEAGASSAAAEVASETPSQQARRLRRQRRRKRKEGLAKKLEFLIHLHKSLDMLVFAYLCVIYYMECSIFFLLLRLFPHYALISHKDVTISLPTHRPYVIAIMAPNILCMLAHTLFSLPQAGEAARGYLHGGAIIDFVGQRPPVWKSGLLYYDVVILLLQCLMLAVHMDIDRIRRAFAPTLRALAGGAAVARAVTSTTGTGRNDLQAAATTAVAEDEEDRRNGTQDHDAEERGVLRDEQPLAAEEEDYANETQPLTGGADAAGGADNARQRQDEERMGMGHSQLRGNAELVDVLLSGNGMLGTFYVVHAIRTAGDNSEASVASLREYAAALTGAIAADRRARLAALSA